MTKKVLPLLLAMMAATASGATPVHVDGVTGATQITSQAQSQKADERRLRKALARLQTTLSAKQASPVQAALAVKGKVVARTAKWQGAVPADDKMQEKATMNYRTTVKGQDGTLTYKFLKQKDGQACAVSIPSLESCIYLSGMPDVAQAVAGAVHSCVAPALEDILGRNGGEE